MASEASLAPGPCHPLAHMLRRPPPTASRMVHRLRTTSVADATWQSYRPTPLTLVPPKPTTPSGNKAPDQRFFDDSPEDRKNVLKDFLQTEQAYVTQLLQLKRIYISPTSRPIPLPGKTGDYFEIPRDQWDMVFGGIQEIVNYHAVDILPTLKGIVRQMTAMGHDLDGKWSLRAAYEVAELFNSRAAQMGKFYKAYGERLCQSLLMAEMWESPQGEPTDRERRIEEFLMKCRAHKEHHMRGLGQYLEVPLQRLAHYELFLRHLCRHTPPKEIEHDPLDITYHFASILSKRVEQSKRIAQIRSHLHPSANNGITPPLNWQILTSDAPDLVMEGPFIIARYLTREALTFTVDNIVIDNEELVYPNNRSETIDTVYYQFGHDHLQGKRLLGVLLADRLVLLADTEEKEEKDEGLGDFKTFAVLRMTEVKDNMKLCGYNKTCLRVCAGTSAYYLETGDRGNAHEWLNEIETLRRERQAETKAKSKKDGDR
ncbi:hypothetical protein L198_03037 [Cryptococcus wingfieldii CBS 7118]|uniref:DH domain-containing protein n=1 Tax=Cryptococcus wingfieldii CBS 7118 TaxID=1295528 RepID=A0A1E3JIJ9_9TREE|nr:hypothetical protein L198_03037 [Cryptococcus wingfieldii CBS 7118]ODO00711.1 hypothetical protein L198_03037 [Cryptococcus wingfieldii CBS 7118]